MNFFRFTQMLLLALSMRNIRSWTTRSHTLRQKLTVSRPRLASRAFAFNSFRWSKDEFSPLSSSHKQNDTFASLRYTDANYRTVATGASESTQSEKETFPKDEFEVNITMSAPSLEVEVSSNVLGIEPNDIDVVVKNSNLDEKPPILSVSEMFRNSQFVDMFRGSANYISSHRNSLVVYHIPGECIDNEDPTVFQDLMNDISLTWLLGIQIVIVAGCRYQVEKRISNRTKHMGTVVTDLESLRIVKEEAGYVRFEVERQLARSLQASRTTGGFAANVVSGNFYSAQPFGVLDGVDFQYSGFVRRFETDKIHRCHENRDIVLLTTLGVSPTGEVFNVNSEYLASHAGGALGANKVIYFLEEDIELRNRKHGSKIPHLRRNDARHLLDSNQVVTKTKGFVYLGDDCPYTEEQKIMMTKIGWAMRALEGGVKRVHMVSPKNGALLQELYTRDGSGTMISGDLYDGIHQATIADVSGIHELISPLIEQGTLVDRPRAVLEKDISQYHVFTRDELVLACGQLKMFENGYAEIGCLVVSSAYRSKGKGDAMLNYLERLCVQRGAETVFVLSTQTMEWFIERGFDEVPVEMLPPSRQANYNRSRASKIYMKKVSSMRELDAKELFWNR